MPTLGTFVRMMSKVGWILIDSFVDGDYTSNPQWGNGGSYPGFSVVSSKLLGASPSNFLYTPYGSTSAGGTYAADMLWAGSGTAEIGFVYPTGTHINPQPRFYAGIQVDGSTLYIVEGFGGSSEVSPATYSTIASVAWAPDSGTYYAYRVQWDRIGGAMHVYINGTLKLSGTLALGAGGGSGAEVYTTGNAGWTNFYYNSNSLAGASPIG